MMRAIIVDDEKHAGVSLGQMIKKNCSEVDILDIVDSIDSALEAIIKYRPELLFLDVELQTGNAFDLLEKLRQVDFEVVFTTAYDHYALKAIKYSALDYLLKPIDIDDLIGAVERVKEKRKTASAGIDIKTLLGNFKNPQKLNVQSTEAVFFIDIAEIVRCQADSNYTRFFLLNEEQPIIATKTLKEYEELLFDQGFMRIHHAHLININHVKKFIKNDYTLLMSDGATVEVSKRKKTEVLLKLSMI